LLDVFQMKIAIRTLKQERFEFNCELSDTIDHLKQLIFEKLGHEKAWQTLIFSGNLLANDRTIESCKITEKDFLVLMVKKPATAAVAKPQTQAQPTQTQPAQTQPAQTQPTQTQPTQTEPQAQPTQTQTQLTQTQPAQTQPAQTRTTPAQAQPQGAQGQNAEYENAVNNLVDMGFPRESVQVAMQLAFNNPEAAFGYLSGEIPMPQEGTQRETASLDDGLDDDLDDDGGGVFDALKNTPQFQQLRILARQNPAMLEQVLAQLPPNIVQVITENQDEFIRLLQEDPVLPTQGQGQQRPVIPQGQGFQQGAQGFPQGAQGLQPQGVPQQMQVRVTPEDQAVIQNIMDMTGCDRNRVMQAYFLFEKDAEMTANYLLNHGHDDGGF